MNVAEFHLAAQRVAGNGCCRCRARHLHGKLWLLPQQFPDAMCSAHGLLKLAVKIGELAHRPRDEGSVEDEAGHLADGDASALQQRGPGPQHHHDGPKQRQDNEGDEPAAQPGPVQRHPQVRVHAPAITPDLECLVHEGLHIEDALQRFLNNDAGFSELVLGLARVPAHLPSEHDGQDDHRRDSAQHDERQPGRGHGNQGDSAQE